eukprot:7565922-Ditylum_brightwellii.AAC.1
MAGADEGLMTMTKLLPPEIFLQGYKCSLNFLTVVENGCIFILLEIYCLTCGRDSRQGSPHLASE